MITWKHYERFLGSALIPRLSNLPNKSQLLRLLDSSSWSDFLSSLSSIPGFTSIDKGTDVKDIVNMAKKHVYDEIAEYFLIVDDDRPIGLALFPEWFVKDKDSLTIQDMVYAIEKLWSILYSIDDDYLTNVYYEWYRYLLLFLYKRAYTYDWDLSTIKKVFSSIYDGDKLTTLLEKGEADPQQIAASLGLSYEIGDVPLLDLEIIVDEYLLLNLRDLAMMSNPLYEIVYYYKALDTTYKNIQIITIGLSSKLPLKEIELRVRDTYV